MESSKKENRDTRKRSKSSITPQQLIELGKLPPQAVELENVVLGAIMLDNQALSKVIDILKAETFYKEAHRCIYTAIKNLFTDSEAIDILTVVQRLKKEGNLEIAGGAFYITQLTNRIASASNIEVHARIIIEKYLQRELIRVCTDVLQRSYDDTTDVFGLMEKSEQDLFSVTQDNIRKNYESISSLLGKAIKQIEDSRDQKFQGIPSGFSRLDSITGGWQNSDLIILGARPAMGKSSLMLALARNACIDFNKPVGIFSLEMTSLQLVMRLISNETEFSGEKLRRGDLSMDEFQILNEKISKLSVAPLYIDDTPALTIFEFKAKAKRLKAQHNVGMIIIDYLQLMVGGEGKGNREQEVGLISRSLKAIAKELDIPIIALSQLSRVLEQRGGSAKRPQLSDLRESGQIEQDADLVMFIHRPEYYGILEDENGNSTQGVAEIVIAKHRNGRIGIENLMFIPHYSKFIEPSYSLFNNQLDESSSRSSVHSTPIRKDPVGNNIEEDF
jgi:replicative DNA helicase